MYSPEQLAEVEKYYKNREQYEPEKDPRQKPPHFCNGGETSGLCHGGPVKMAEGGYLDDFDVSGGDSQTVKNAQQVQPVPAFNPVIPPTVAKKITVNDLPEVKSPFLPQGGEKVNPQQELQDYFSGLSNRTTKYGPEFQQKVAGIMNKGRNESRLIAQPLATLADALMTGVARAENPHFAAQLEGQEKESVENAEGLGKELNAQEQETVKTLQQIAQQNPGSILSETQMKALAPMLEKAGMPSSSYKYMTPDIAEKVLTGAINLEEAQARLAQLKSEEEMKKTIAGANLPATGVLHPSTWGKGQTIEAARNALMGGVLPSGPGGNIPTIKTHAEYLALPLGTRYQNDKGEHGIKK